MPELSIDGCMEFFGAHVKLCIEDYAAVHKDIDKLNAFISKYNHLSKTRLPIKVFNKINRLSTFIRNYESARHYLFNDDGLASDIRRLNLPLSIEYTRQQANKMAEIAKFN